MHDRHAVQQRLRGLRIRAAALAGTIGRVHAAAVDDDAAGAGDDDPVVHDLAALGWYNTLNPLWVPAWFGGAFFIFLMVQHMKTIPRELEEARASTG